MYATNTGYRWMSGPTRTLGASMALAALCGVSPPTWAVNGSSGSAGERVEFLGVATEQGVVSRRHSAASRFHGLAGRAMDVARKSRDGFLGTNRKATRGHDKLLTQAMGAATEFAKNEGLANHAAGASIKPGDDRLEGHRHKVNGAHDKEAGRQTKLAGPGLNEILVTHELPEDLSTIISFEPLPTGGVRPRPSQVAKDAPPSEALLIPKPLLTKSPYGGLEQLADATKANTSLAEEVTSVVVRTPVLKGSGQESSLIALFNQRTVEITVKLEDYGEQTYVFGVTQPEEATK